MVTFYHGTSASRVESILESGLIPPKCPRHVKECDCGRPKNEHGNFNYESNHLKKNFGFIYLAEGVTDAFGWANANDWDGDDVVLAVKIRKEDLEPDPIVAGAWRARGPIPPEKISIVDLGVLNP